MSFSIDYDKDNKVEYFWDVSLCCGSSRQFVRGCLEGGRKIITSTTKILKGGTTFRWVYIQKFRSIWL